MNITIASHYGMCFGVRDALRTTHDIAIREPLTVLGELVHNPVVRDHLRALGAKESDLDETGEVDTKLVVITAHGSATSQKEAWAARGHRVIDTTCPLVTKAHKALEALAVAGYQPVVIGKKNHVEVRGLTKDLPQTAILLDLDEVANLPEASRYGVVAQTTQPIDHVRAVCEAIATRFPDAEVRFSDTVCQPTKDRQHALVELCRTNDTIVVVGGRNSNNTAQLTTKARLLECRAFQVEDASQLQREWFRSAMNVGITAGTSTLDETLHAVVQRLRSFDAGKSHPQASATSSAVEAHPTYKG